MNWRQKGMTYAVVVPFAIFLAFPFYFALVTMFKTNLDLANVEHSPYLYNDLEGGFHWDFWNYATTEHVRFLFEETNYPTWLLNTLLVGAAVVFGAYGTAVALVGTQLPILPLRLYSLISETGSDFPAAAALALLITAVCSTIITTGEWMGAKHERHL